MKSVVVIGAGGSLANAIAIRPKRALEYPPLDGNFFDRAQVLAQHRKPLATSLASLRNKLNRTGLFPDPWESVAPITMEQFFADVYYEVAARRSAEAFGIFVDLLLLYSKVLGVTTNWQNVERARSGSIGALLRHEIRRAAGDALTVITFNQDLVLEQAVHHLPRIAGQWCLKGLYGDINLLASNAPSGAVFPHHSSACGHSPPLKVLKLHGSLNWGMISATATPALATIFPREKARKRIYVTDSAAIRESRTITLPNKRGRKRWHLWPLLVPPIYEKQRITGIPVLQRTWDLAAKAVEEAERMTLVGYSLPASDVLARQMLRRAFGANTDLECVECVNPDPTLAEVLRGSLGARVVKLYDGIPAYIRYS